MKTQISKNTRNETKDITIDPADIKRIRRRYKLLYCHKFDNLRIIPIPQKPKTTKKFNQDETDNLDSPITIKIFELII